MFEEFTQEKIFELALSKAEDFEVSTIPGSLVYNSSALMAIMLENAFDKGEEIYINAFPDTCDREHLIRFARAKGLTVKSATAAEYQIKTNVQLPIGCQLTANDLTFSVFEQNGADDDGFFVSKIRCADTGSVGDGQSGELETIDEVSEFESAVFVSQTKKSTEDEETEDFRERYFETFSMPGQFGNKRFYKESAASFEGVGAVKVESTADGEVTLTVVDTDGKSASAELCQKMQNEIQKPICQQLSVVGASAQALDFSLSVKTTKELTNQDAVAAVKKVISNYIKEINLKDWESGALKVRLPIIQMRIFEIENITDCEIEPIGGKFTVEIDNGKIAEIGAVDVTIA